VPPPGPPWLKQWGRKKGSSFIIIAIILLLLLVFIIGRLLVSVSGLQVEHRGAVWVARLLVVHGVDRRHGLGKNREVGSVEQGLRQAQGPGQGDGSKEVHGALQAALKEATWARSMHTIIAVMYGLGARGSRGDGRGSAVSRGSGMARTLLCNRWHTHSIGG
jgi:hypothetical protein